MSQRLPICHPYARISDPEQRKGGGLERQTAQETGAAIKEFCRLYGFTPSKRILIDDGVSAWKGLNATPEHELGKFIEEANRGLIRPGDCLLVELLDRITRQDVWAAMGLVNDLRQLGIHIGRLDRMKLLRCDSKDMGDFFEAAVEFSRGNSESEAKSYRNGKKWAERRQQGRENGKTITRRLPAWVEDQAGQRVLIPHRAEVIRHIFELSAAGRGLYAILRKLAHQGIEGFGPSGKWSVSYLGLLLSDRRVLGEFQPRRGSKGKGEADGEPIKDYFPRIIADELWSRVRQGAAARHRRPGKVTALVNVFAGLIRSARDGTSYASGRETGKGKPYRILRSTAPRTASGHAYSFPFTVFERALFSQLREVDAHAILNGDSGPDETIVLAGELALVEGDLAAMKDFMEKQRQAGKPWSPTIGEQITVLESRQRELGEGLAEARQRAEHPLSETWGETQTLLAALDAAADPEDARLRLRAALRQIVEGIWLLVVPRGRDRLAWAQLWFHGKGRRRDYLILHRPPRANASSRTPGRAFVESKPQLTAPCDLRRPEDARKLEARLAAVDVETLAAVMRPLPSLPAGGGEA
jgi:hypothetical protein